MVPTPPALRRGRLHAAALAAVLASALGAGCNCGETPLGTGMPDRSTITCTRCHGDPATGDPAPPADLDGRTDTSLVGIGAHQQHLTDGPMRKAVGCAECHLVPTQFDDPGHNTGTGRAVVTWGPLANQQGALAPSWSHDQHTCSGVYCHGQTLAGGTLKQPDWVVLDGTQAACGTCHGNPPPAPHPASTNCASCHALTVKPDGTIDVAGGHHVDGVLDLPDLGCTSCHGTAGRTGADPHVDAAPPVGTKGETATTDAAVGAHLQHLNGGTVRTGLACTECHVVPTDAAHADGKSPKLVFGALATTRGLSPSEDPATRTCSSTYCHGTTLSGGTNKIPKWTQVDGTQAACGTCHGNPPPPPHVQQSDCASCHPGTVKADGTIDLAGGLHVNGVIDVAGLTCTSCHGTAGRTGTDPHIDAAPPVGTKGETATTSPAVGAHLAHLTDSAIRAAVACADCHAVPVDSAHSDGASPKLVWGALAKTGSLSPSEDPSTHACSSTWCHGASLSGGTNKAPVWTTVDGSQAACGTCHGAPPPAPHPQNASCSTCHPATVKPDGTIDVAGGKHIDGVVDAPSLTCTSCHGTATRASVSGADPLQPSAPPVDTAGNADGSFRGVGAHLSHVNPGTGAVARPFACDQCHTVPTQMDHAIGVVDVTFGSIATAQASSPTWTRASNTCASAWCHGGNAKLVGGNRPSIVWTDPTATDCTSCHGNPPPAPHVQNDACGTCHGSGYSKTGATAGTVDLATHVDGKIDTVALTCTTCHGTAGRTGADPAIAAAPPVGTRGETATSTRAVGAHLAHLSTGALADAFACAECHAVPAGNLHATGTVEMTFGTIAKTRGATPAWNGTSCATSYCHGKFTNGNAGNAPAWTAGTGEAACGTCHGTAADPTPGGTHPFVAAATSCSDCHPGYTRTTVDVAKHVNGVVDVSGMTCWSCHGDKVAKDPAPPLDTKGNSATTFVGVGAHQGHLHDGSLRTAVACTECHPSPTTMIHSDGTVDLAFGALANQGTATAWNAGTATCASNYCHGDSAATKGGLLTKPVWTKVDGTQKTCTSCHGNPPPAPHPQLDTCGNCHPGGYSKTGADTGTVAVSTHIDGTVDLGPMTCTSCHGTTGRTGADPAIAAAPPIGTRGETATTTRAVGAHLAHLSAGALSDAFACAECHAVPTSMTHATGTVEMAFGTLAKTRGATPAWNGTTCATSYCHGRFTNGNAGNAPAWTAGGPAAACGTCHGTALDPVPGGTHPFVAPTTACSDCHPGYTRTTVDVAKHVNGVVEVSGLSCTSCHGDKPSNDPAPPVDTKGNSATTFLGVGAHQGHVHDGSLRPAVACTECHPTPATQIHSDGTVEVTFGALANQGTTTTWTGGTATCASNYCHGDTAATKGGLLTRPVWTKVDGTQKTCASCHGNPPPAPHVQNDACGSCHGAGYAKTGAATGTVAVATHVDGKVDLVALTCTTCHGTTGRAPVAGADPNQAAAPPTDTTGAGAATDLQVGAHLAHVNHGTGAVSSPIACLQCHPVPASNSHANGTIQVTFGALAKSQGSSPAFTVASGTGTCASTWCHGGNALLLGGNKTTLAWNDGVTATDCTSCHGNPPPAPHVQNPACANCHGSGYSRTGATTGTVNVPTHVDGKIDYVSLSCATCHGDPGRTGADPNITAAPPTGTAGETASTTRAVGAHLAHLQPGPYSNGLACTECHVIPAGNLHANGTATVTFGTLAKTGGATPSWNGTTCASAYCHGQFKNGNSTNDPTWTGGSAEAACGTCHGTLTDPTPTTGHPAVAPTKSCGDCHDGYTRTTVNLALHVNGVIDGGGEPSSPGSSCGSCHQAIFEGMTGTVAKATKHTLGGGDNPVDPGGSWTTAATLKASPLYASASCVSMCHGDHPHDLTSPVVATHQNNAHLDANARSASRTSATRASTDFVSTGTGGLCLSCHTKPVDATHAALDQAGFAASAHNYSTNAQGTWQYTLHDGSAFARNCTKCHADPADGRPGDATTPFGAVHFSDNASLLAGTPRAAGAPANLLCYRCHGNATTGQDLSGKDVATQIAKAVRHPVDSDSVHDSATEDAAPASTYGNGRYSGANRHANCIDCHSPHEAKSGAHAYATTATSTRNAVSGPLAGVGGVQFNTTGLGNFAAPAAANFTWIPPATGAAYEYQICFKCHSSFTFGATPPNGVSANGSATTPVETDVAQEFNPNNLSGHPVVTGLNNYANSAAPKSLNALDLLAPWNTNVGTQTMMCSDCHNNDAASPAAQGPHGSALSFMTRGSKTGWPTAVASATGFATTMCSDCHANAPIHTRDGAHSAAACYRCHIVVPHGGKMSRLVGDRDSAAMPSRYAYGDTKTNLYIQSFTKNSRSAYVRSNCQASCTTEHSTAATENW